MDWITIIAAWLIIYRIATDIAYMDGPFDAFAYLRGWIVQRYGSNHWVSHGIQCPICISLWIAIILAVVMMDWRIAAGAGFVTLAIRSTRE